MTARQADELLAVSLAETLCRCAGGGGAARLVVPDSPTDRVQDGPETGPPQTSDLDYRPVAEAVSRPSKRRRTAKAGSHSTLRLLELQTEADVADFFRKNLTSYRAQSGAITFLYALIPTKGLDRLQSEMGDSAEPLGTPCAAATRRV